MTVEEVITNLNRTIEGKRLLQNHLQGQPASLNLGERLASEATLRFLQLNIEELGEIRTHLEACLPKK